MKKLLLLSLIFIVSNVHCDELSDAIRETNVEKVRLILDKGTISLLRNNKYLAVAQEIIQLRRQQVALNSPIPKSVPGTVWIKMGALASAVGVIIKGFELKHMSFDNYPYDSWQNYENEIINTQCMVFASACCCIAIGALWYWKKIKYLENTYKDALVIYELVYDGVSRASNHSPSNLI